MGLAVETPTMGGSTGSDPDPSREIKRVHVLFEDCLGGVRDGIDPFADALAAEFQYVALDGTRHERADAIDRLEAAAGRYADSSPRFVVDIRNVDRRLAVYDLHFVTYERHQRVDGDWSGRACTALLHETDDAPTGMEWLSLQETPRMDPEDGEQADEQEASGAE